MPVGKDTLRLAHNAVKDGFWSGGSGASQEELRSLISKYTKKKYVTLVNSGTAACRAALFATIGWERKSTSNLRSVLTTSYSCAANLLPIIEMGAVPWFADIELDTFGMIADRMTATVGAVPSAIFLVHIYGERCRDADKFLEYSHELMVPVIEDFSECMGMTFDDLPTGDIIVASLRAEKLWGCGEGGFVATNDEGYHTLITQFCNRGKPTLANPYWYTTYGDNVMMPGITAAVALGQHEILRKHVAGKRRVALWYRASRVFQEVGIWQALAKGGVAWLNCLMLNPSTQITAADLAKALRADGVETRPAFYPLQCYAKNLGVGWIGSTGENAKALHRNGIVLPSPYDLTKDEFRYIESCIRRYLKV